MADIKGFLATNFLNAEMVRNNGSDWMITSEAEIEPEGKFGEELRMDVEGVNGMQFVYSINKTSAARLAKAWGGDSKGWVGKKLRISLVKVMVQKELKDSLQAEPLVVETQKVV